MSDTHRDPPTSQAPPPSSSASSPLRVAVIDRCVPHYRKGLYDELMGCGRAGQATERGFEFTIVAAAVPVERIGTIRFPGRPGSPSRANRARTSEDAAEASVPGADSPASDSRLGEPGSPRWRWIDAPGYRVPFMRGAGVWQWGAIKAALGRRFDALLIMANPNDPSLWLAAILGRLAGKRIVFWTHGLTRRDRWLHRRLRVVWLRLAHALCIYGHLGKAGCMQEGFPPQRCHVCYNSLDYPHQRALRDRLSPQQIAQTKVDLFGTASAPVALSISRLSAFKKIEVLIRAHAALVNSGADVRLLIVGDGPQRASLEALARELGAAERIVFFGECYDEDRLAGLIAASDLCITPGAIGLSVMHCLAYGVPCVTHDDPFDQMPEFEAIIDGRTGAFFRKDDADDLARLMRQWLLPAPRKPQVSSACIAHLERFYTPQVQAAVMKRVLRGEPADDLWVAYGRWRDGG